MMKDRSVKRQEARGVEREVGRAVAVLRLINCADACHRADHKMTNTGSVKLKIRHATFTRQCVATRPAEAKRERAGSLPSGSQRPHLYSIHTPLCTIHTHAVDHSANHKLATASHKL